MGQGIDLARDDSPVHAAILDNFKDQLLLALVRKAGGNIKVKASEIDANGGWLLKMSVVDGVFQFKAEKKQ